MKTSGDGLPRATSSDETVASKCCVETGVAQDGVDQRPVRRRREGDAERVAESPHCVGCPVDEWQRRVALAHPADHLDVDLLRRIGDPDDIVEVARPLGRAHAGHVRLRLVAPAAAALARKPLAHLVPDVVGVDEDAVEVEDDRLDLGQARVTLSRPIPTDMAAP